MPPPTTFSLRLNNDLTVGSAVALARAAEAAGFDQIWISNDLFLRSSPVLLSAMAGATSRIAIGSGILNPYTVHPAELAMLAATLDELSEGRFRLGLAAGAAEFLGWVGVEQRRPLQTVRETIVSVRALLRGERPPPGEVFSWSEEAFLRFPSRPLPIYLGASGPRMQELIGELADGALPLLFPPERYAEVRARVAVGEERRDPDLEPVDFAACFWVSVDADPERARAPLAEKVAYYGPAMGPHLLRHLGVEDAELDPIREALAAGEPLSEVGQRVDERMLRVGVAGSPDEVVERLRPIRDAGAEHLSFGPPLGPDPEVAVRLLGRDVLPALR
ncbi:MAG: LLM class flavin-dependent oxidoreductase [Acidobacteria bacterium]|nr:MAG: LLM class flavin-dependent oxidoreductase [Acidobacteriota bacterium]REK06391.1 MAG: LLM class flavin-dependent oxidoreductase [Acidobacteriota bacterium]